KLEARGFVLGSRRENTKRATAQLGRLEKLMESLVDRTPPLKGRFKKAKVGGGNFLTLALDGSMVPWEQVPLNKIEKNPGEFDGLVKKLKQLKLTVAVGTRDNYLLLGIGETTAPVAALGGNKSLLELDELKPLAKHAGKKLTSVNYTSKAFSARAGLTKRDVDAGLESWQGLLPR